MSAVNLARLRFQLQGLMKFYESPPEFHQRLVDLFTQYAHHALRFGETISIQPLIPMYHLPRPLVQQLEVTLKKQINNDPDAALQLADRLWQDEYFEVKRTAIFILGHLPIDDPEPVRSRIKTWLEPGLDGTLSAYLLSHGGGLLQEKFPQTWEDLIHDLLMSEETKLKALGVLGLTERIRSPGFENLPAVFRLISPLIRNPRPGFTRELETLIEALINRSPTETEHFLKQIHLMSDSPETTHLIKQCLPKFPDHLSDDLRRSLRNSN